MMHNEIASAADVNARNTFLVNFLIAVMDKLTAMPETELTAFYDDICANAMVDTTFAVPDFISEISLIYAWNDPSFQKTTLEYPGRYVSASENMDGYFEPNIKQAITQFKNYRRLPETDAAGESK